MDRLTLTAGGPTPSNWMAIVGTIFIPVIPTGLLMATFALISLSRVASASGNPLLWSAVLLTHLFLGFLLLGFVTVLLIATLQVGSRPDLTLVLRRHRLNWGERTILLEDIRGVSPEGLRVQLDDEELVLPGSLRVDANSLATFRSALVARVRTLSTAQVRTEDRRQLASLQAMHPSI